MKTNKPSLSAIYQIFCIVLLSCCLISCASTQATVNEMESGNKNITVDNILKITKGVSSKEDIETIFGKPDSAVTNADTQNTTWTYIYTKTKQNSFDRSPFLIDQMSLDILFSAQGIVKGYTQTVSNRLKAER